MGAQAALMAHKKALDMRALMPVEWPAETTASAVSVLDQRITVAMD